MIQTAKIIGKEEIHTFNGINLEVIYDLKNKVKSMYNKKGLITTDWSEDKGDLDPLSLFYDDENLNALKDYIRKGIVSIPLEKKYPGLTDMIDCLENDYPMGYRYLEPILIDTQALYGNIEREKLLLKYPGGSLLNSTISIPLEAISKLIIKHNISLGKIPAKNEFLKEKNHSVDWRGYNTPSFKKPTITPLYGTDFFNFEDISPWSIHTQYRIASYYLFWEFNILDKAHRYMNNKRLNLPVTIQEENAFNFWSQRQICLQFYSKASQLYEIETYFHDYSLYSECLYREVSEDYLYVLLNLPLIKAILDGVKLNLYSDTGEGKFSSETYFARLESVVKLYYKNNDKGYNCLRKLRLFWANNYLTAHDLKFISNLSIYPTDT